tara:strand:+ start:605 stop:1048 length:444 start_codon:yes stop_codon:yes gene_type:complete
MKPLIELELGSIQFVYGEYFVNDDMGIDEFIDVAKKYKLKYTVNSMSYLMVLLTIILLPLTNLLITSLSILTLCLITYFFVIQNFYDWYGLYESIKENGFNPNEDNGYITVKLINGQYLCQNGNHRVAILNLIHDKSYKLKVWEVPI